MLFVRAALAAVVLTAAACASLSRDPVSHARQAIVVTTAGWAATTGTLQRYEREGRTAAWRRVGVAAPVVVGRNGLAPVGEKREGDGRSPAGIFSLGMAFGFAESADLRVTYHMLHSTTECVDDPASRFYNQIVERDAVPAVDWSSSEKMRTIDQYRWGIVVDDNTPAVPKRGSCIFLHIWSGPASTTSGCTAMKQEDLEALLHWLDPAANPLLVQFPRGEYARIGDFP